MFIKHQLLKSEHPAANLKPTLVLIHGLFGEGKNLKILSDALNKTQDVLIVDLRNHGGSFHDELHTYDAMAEDITSILRHLNISRVNLIGHSMGGKVAMTLAKNMFIKINKIIVLDIAPVNYTLRKHDDVFAGLKQVIINHCKTRLEASTTMNKFIKEPTIIQFLLKSFDKGNWRFNLDVLEKNYDIILDWHLVERNETPILFLIGALSDYVLPEHKDLIVKQFPNSRAHIIAGAAHWVHADKPEQVIKQINKFLD